MTKTTKSLMVISTTCLVVGLAFVTGIINVQNAVALYVALPAGAIVFGLFMIFKTLEKEALLFDEEQRARQAFGAAPKTVRKAEQVCSCDVREAAAIRH